MKKKQIRRAITLIEMIVVMMLIATITGAVAFNYQKSLNEGRAFRTKEGKERVETMISLFFAEHPTEDKNRKGVDAFKQMAKESPLVKNEDDFLKDGWGNYFEIETRDTGSDVEISVKSPRYENYLKEKKHDKTRS